MTPQTAYHRKRRRRFRRAALCVWCGQASPDDGRTLCADCLEIRRNLYEARRAEARCTKCGVKVRDESWACADCRARNAAAKRKARKLARKGAA